MRFLIFFAVAVFFQSSADAADYVGHWFSCSSKWQVRDNFSLVEITKAKAEYRWLMEWGVAYTASGTAEVAPSGSLVLRGCKSYRGVRDKSCDVLNPPVYLTLPRSLLDNPISATQSALLRGTWLRTSELAWKKLAERCAQLNSTGKGE